MATQAPALRDRKAPDITGGAQGPAQGRRSRSPPGKGSRRALRSQRPVARGLEGAAEALCKGGRMAAAFGGQLPPPPLRAGARASFTRDPP